MCVNACIYGLYVSVCVCMYVVYVCGVSVGCVYVCVHACMLSLYEGNSQLSVLFIQSRWGRNPVNILSFRNFLVYFEFFILVLRIFPAGWNVSLPFRTGLLFHLHVNILS